MSPEAWGFFSVLTTVGAGTFVELVRTRRKVEKSATAAGAAATAAAVAATEVADLARPTGNGFAREVLTGLATLQSGQEEIRRRLDRHIEDHASADAGARRRRN
ncbi:MAG TPA: hypothetical protein VLL08_31435 [Kineosporiaceae bacterium]|nr:hypothetical protein [Kineosporiaceae bacterium]